MQDLLHVSYADEKFTQSAALLSLSARRFGVRDIRIYGPRSAAVLRTFSENPSIRPDMRGAGYWLWKPYIILDAMAHGVVVIADASTSSDAIIDGRTAMTVGGRGAEHWARAIRNVLDDEDTHAAIRKEAHRLILTERRGHVHLSALMRVYEGLATGEPIAFRAAGPPHSSR